MSALHMIQAAVDGRRLVQWALARRMDADDIGYVTHALMRDAWGKLGPQPFVASENMGHVKILGYGSATAEELQAAAAEFAEPEVAACILGVSSKEMPVRWESGRRMGFQVRVAPTRQKHVAGGRHQEADALSFEEDGADREEVYKNWLARKFGESVTLDYVQMTAFRKLCACRRGLTANGKRPTRTVTIPDAQFRGVLRIKDTDAFNHLLASGLGRHKAFGFGALLLKAA
jgi:CRISPR system Cascade subunit CasE